MRSRLAEPRRLIGLALTLGALTTAACDDLTETTMAEAIEPDRTEIAPTGLTEVALGASTIALWPYTGTDAAGAISDPINLFFPGVDVRDVRTVLLALDGNRTAFGMPPVAPFDCRWSDAIGANQSSYTAEHGWQGSAIQLECGDYQPMRFHVRLFDAGDGVVGNAHFEVIIPGTNQHEVLSWELAEQILIVDMIRSGLLVAAPGTSPMINPAPAFKTINPLIYNGLPVALRGLIGGPLGAVSSPVPIPSDGRATILALGGVPAPTPMDATENTVLVFGQVIPKPFCSTGPLDYVYVTGPIAFEQRIVVSAAGEYSATFNATGALQVTPFDPIARQPTGATYRAQVKAVYAGMASDDASRASNFDRQILLRDGQTAQRMVSHFQAGTGSDFASVAISCD